MGYDIINRNLEKLSLATKTFPNIIGKYRKIPKVITHKGYTTSDNEERRRLITLASQLGLTDYIYFIDWSTSVDLKALTKKNIISFTQLKTALVENSIDQEVKDILSKKTKRGMITLLKSNAFNKFNGGYKRATHKNYNKNFEKTLPLIINFFLQNNIDASFIPHYFKSDIPNVESEINTELDITNDITKTILRKIKTIKYDFRKLNFNMLKSEIEGKIKERMLSVERGEQIKCIDDISGLTKGKIYNVNGYSITSNGSLGVTVTNDFGNGKQFPYRSFESVSKLRDNHINDILNLIENEG